MKHPASWLSAVLAIACLVLGYLVIHQKTELALVRSQLGSAAEDAQKRIIDLQHQVAAAKAATATGPKRSGPTRAPQSSISATS